MASKLITLQNEVVNSRLLVDPMFASIPVISEDLKDPESEMQAAINKVGIAVMVATPEAASPLVNIAGVYFNSVSLTCLVIENPSYNKTGYRYLEVAEQIVKLFSPPYIPATLSTTLEAKSPTIQNVPDKFFRIVRVRFDAKCGLTYDIPQVGAITRTTVPTPIVDPVATTSVAVTLTCATTGAMIYYTVDGSNPMPRNGTRYTTAITISTACTLRAKAFLPGYDTSAEHKSVYV